MPSAHCLLTSFQRPHSWLLRFYIFGRKTICLVLFCAETLGRSFRSVAGTSAPVLRFVFFAMEPELVSGRGVAMRVWVLAGCKPSAGHSPPCEEAQKWFPGAQHPGLGSP